MAPYERLHAWRECHELALAVYRVTKSFPSEEQYGLTSQTRRAAFSAAVNIVEGSSRRSRKEFRRFLDISLSSLTEVGYALRFSRENRKIGRAHVELQSHSDLVCRLLLEKKNLVPTLGRHAHG